MSKRAVEEYLVALKRKPVFKPSIRKKPSSSTKSDKARDEGHPEMAQTEIPGPTPTSEETPSPPPPASSRNLLEPAEPETYNFRFSADKDFKEKFERLAEVLGVENPLKNMTEVFERAVEISLDKKDPKRKLERRLERERKQCEENKKSCPGKISGEEATKREKKVAQSRYISSEVRERLFERASYQCEFEARDGTRCSARTGLEIDHEQPFAIYRSHDERRLRVLCRRHNIYMAENYYGADFIRAKIGEKRRHKATRSTSPDGTGLGQGQLKGRSRGT
jgi:hypothetical protein